MPFTKVVYYIKYLSIIFIFLSLSYLMYNQYENENQKIRVSLEAYHKNTSLILDSYLKQFEHQHINIYEIFFRDKQIAKMLLDGQTETLKEELFKFYKNYLITESSLYAIDLFSSDFKLISHMHSIKNITDKKEQKLIVKKAIQSRKVQSGFEHTNIGYFYKIVYPIFGDGKFLGVSEFSYKLGGFVDFLYQQYGLKAAFIFKIDGEQEYTTEYVSPKYINGYMDEISLSNEKTQIFKHEENKYFVDILKLPDFKNFSKFVAFHDITKIENEKDIALYKFFVFLSIAFVLCVVAISNIVSFFVSYVKAKEDKLEEKAKELYFNSRHNELTKLPNSSVMNEATLTHENYSVLMLNVDNVEILSSTYGKDIVKVIFFESAELLEKNIPSNAMLYHMSEDEFAIILNNPKENQEMMICSQIKAYFEHTPLSIENFRIHVQFSMGIGIHKEEDNSKLNVFSKANIALVEAKHRAKGLILIYSNEMSRSGSYNQLAKNIAILQNDLENETLIPFYQPIVDTYTQDIVKYEVLARIKDDVGFIPPHKFMEAAEVAGLQTAVTKQIIQKSFKYFASKNIEFSINITKHDLIAKYLPQFLELKTKSHNIKPQNVTLEILEDIAIENNEEMIEQINYLHTLGYVIAIDDFGVESSNISKLSDLEADFIKIDGIFIKDIDTNKKHLHIVESLVFMAKKLDMRIVAEFVHSQSVYDVVKELGIDYCQGYFFSEPKENI